MSKGFANNRLTLLALGVAACFMAVGVRLVYLHVIDRDELLLTAALKDGTKLIDVLKVLADAGVDPVDINRREASLDDVFLTLTSRKHQDLPRREDDLEEAIAS